MTAFGVDVRMPAMNKFGARLLSGLLLAAFIGGAIHRHDVHDGGLSPEHVDCVVCAWTPKGHTPSINGSDAFFAPANRLRRIPLPERPHAGFFFSRSSKSRAPPAL